MTPVLIKKRPASRKEIPGIQRRGKANPLNRRKERAKLHKDPEGRVFFKLPKKTRKRFTDPRAYTNLRGLKGDLLAAMKGVRRYYRQIPGGMRRKYRKLTVRTPREEEEY